MLTGISHPTTESRFRSFPLRVIFIGMGVALVMCAGNGKPVWASCGDYLEHAVQKHEALVKGALPAANDDITPHEPGPCSCKGSQCQEAPSPPLPLSPTTNLVTDSHWGWRPESELLANANQHVAFLIFNAFAVSEGYPLRIEHPPRD